MRPEPDDLAVELDHGGVAWQRHGQLWHSTLTSTGLRWKVLQDEYGPTQPAGPAPAVVERFDEWAVIGEPGSGYPPYRFVWSRESGPVGGRDDPEQAAKTFAARVLAHRWQTGPELMRRTITRSEWQSVALPADPAVSDSG